MSNDAARDFLQSISGFTLDEGAPKSSADRPVRLATVHGGYAGTGPARVTFDGEGTATTKAYVVMEPVAAADRVVLLPVGQGYVILGKLGGGAWYSALVAADTAAAARLTTLEDRSWVVAVATAISSSGSTAALDTTTGTVTIPAGCTQLRLDGIFQAGYEYEFQLDLSVDGKHTTDSSALIRVREGGVTNSAAGYQTAGNYAQYNGVGGLYTINNGTIAAIGAVSGNGSYVNFVTTLRMRAAALNGGTGKEFFYSIDSFTSGSARGVKAGGYTPAATTAFDGIEFWWNSSLTGLAQGKIHVFKRKLL